MNAFASALNAGFSSLLQTNGEELLFRSTVVKAVVDRNPIDRGARAPDFDPRDSSEIRFFTSAVSAIPETGEELTDDYGMSHRVQTVKTLGGFYTCRCLPNIPEPEALANETPEMLITDDAQALQAG